MSRGASTTAVADGLTAAVAEIRAARVRLAEVRAAHPRGSMWAMQAFNDLCRVYARHGLRIDQLNTFSPDEDERFFAQTVDGPDGHVYWTGGRDFRRNDGRKRLPHRWWYEHVHGPIPSVTLRLNPVCDDRRCINPRHMELHHFVSRRYTDAQMLGKLQTVAMRLGHTPSVEDWKRLGGTPNPSTYHNVFGSWTRAIRAAGLDPPVKQKSSPSVCIEGLRAARRLLGHWPSQDEYHTPRVREHLAALHLPTSNNTIRTHLGGWPEALRKAGRR